MERADLIATDRYSILCIAGQNFAVAITNMKEVIPFPKMTQVPNTEAGILGVFNLRGQIWSAIDLRVLLKLEKSAITEKNFIVLVEDDGINFGVVVDRVLDVTMLDNSKIQVPTREFSQPFVQFLNGYYKHKKLGLIYMLDLPAILQSKELKRYRYI